MCFLCSEELKGDSDNIHIEESVLFFFKGGKEYVLLLVDLQNHLGTCFHEQKSSSSKHEC